MSGHSKWNNIKHKKEKSDAAKAKIFTKIGKEMAVAIKAGAHMWTGSGKAFLGCSGFKQRLSSFQGQSMSHQLDRDLHQQVQLRHGCNCRRKSF